MMFCLGSGFGMGMRASGVFFQGVHVGFWLGFRSSSGIRVCSVN